MVKFTEKALGNGEINLSDLSYGKDFKEKIFWVWYNSGQIYANKLLIKLQEDFGRSPSIGTLQSWIAGWRDRAEELDQQIKDQFSKEVIETKVEMLKRHASLGKEMQQIGVEWLRENIDELTAASVVRLIKDGSELERNSVGVPEAITKMLSTSDDDLKKEIEDIITSGELKLIDDAS